MPSPNKLVSGSLSIVQPSRVILPAASNLTTSPSLVRSFSVISLMNRTSRCPHEKLGSMVSSWLEGEAFLGKRMVAMNHRDCVAMFIESNLVHERADQKKSTSRRLFEVHRLGRVVIETLEVKTAPFILDNVSAFRRRFISSYEHPPAAI